MPSWSPSSAWRHRLQGPTWRQPCSRRPDRVGEGRFVVVRHGFYLDGLPAAEQPFSVRRFSADGKPVAAGPKRYRTRRQNGTPVPAVSPMTTAGCRSHPARQFSLQISPLFLERRWPRPPGCNKVDVLRRNLTCYPRDNTLSIIMDAIPETTSSTHNSTSLHERRSHRPCRPYQKSPNACASASLPTNCPPAPGDEQALAADYGISRTPLREALKVLCFRGPGDAFTVMAPPRLLRHRNFRARSGRDLHRAVAPRRPVRRRHRIARRPDADFARLRSIHDDLERAAADKDIDGFFEANQTFHQEVQADRRQPLADPDHHRSAQGHPAVAAPLAVQRGPAGTIPAEHRLILKPSAAATPPASNGRCATTFQRPPALAKIASRKRKHGLTSPAAPER